MVSAISHFWERVFLQLIALAGISESAWICSHPPTAVTAKHNTFSRAYRRGDVPGASPEPCPSSNQGSRQRLSAEGLDTHAPRPGRAEIRRDHTGLGTRVRRCLQFCAVGVPPCGLAGALCRVYAAIPAAGGVQWIHALPAGDEQDHHMALDSGAGGYGFNYGLGRHGDRGRFQPLFLASAVLPRRWPGTRWSSRLSG